jgi:hypothetical protein
MGGAAGCLMNSSLQGTKLRLDEGLSVATRMLQDSPDKVCATHTRTHYIHSYTLIYTHILNTHIHTYTHEHTHKVSAIKQLVTQMNDTDDARRLISDLLEGDRHEMMRLKRDFGAGTILCLFVCVCVCVGGRVCVCICVLLSSVLYTLSNPLSYSNLCSIHYTLYQPYVPSWVRLMATIY